MDSRADFRSIQQYLPVTLHASDVIWPPTVVESLKSLSKGPSHSNVSSGELFAAAIVDLRKLLGLDPLHPAAPLGFSLFFNDLMNKDDALKWFGEVVPQLANLLLRLPALLEAQYKNADALSGTETGLRVLEVQNPGIVILSQELIAALLACGLFCLFPAAKRGGKKPQPINFDKLFVILYQRKKENQENKIKCLVHYFERVCKNMPRGNVSFERKVLPLRNSTADYWSKSAMPLCKFEVHTYGKIEDQSTEVLEVDFADKHIGGLILKQGCVQEEIRFAINPELIASILFLPVMADNEAIEIVGPERSMESKQQHKLVSSVSFSFKKLHLIARRIAVFLLATLLKVFCHCRV
ncbi:Poly(ADP-ribose) glycohydrolase 1 [Striga hermonthica]|uniref:poly(ADP-ribose) glycohydrolase n=1 Tax=Striga hermonthica TaxID=68872 RepID=A0A9N7NZ88_STRHE|nr:Poly(ADP-ribose) glycohydrolase 1 [Striga hermonthica]